MADSIVTDSGARMPGVKTSTRWFCDVFTGSTSALIEAGIITADNLVPQKGRLDGRTAFLPNGKPCPANYRAWREPGYKLVQREEDGIYCVEVTIAKDAQTARRKLERAAERAADHEREQQRINEELAKRGPELRSWKLNHRFLGWHERWEGTKAQLQAEGLGIGLSFPGEDGAPEQVKCKCPLGFDVTIKAHWQAAEAAAGIYVAESPYTERTERSEHPEGEQPTVVAPGVMREAWRWWSPTKDTYVGAASALVDAGIVPAMSLFPGQPGLARTRVTYYAGWSHRRTSRDGWSATIAKRGKTKFEVRLPVSEDEARRREELVDADGKQNKGEQWGLAEERQKLRALASARGRTVAEFRAARAKETDVQLDFIWNWVFTKPDGTLRFDIREDSELWDDLADAFQTIREVVESADVVVDEQLEGKLQSRLQITAARNDKGLQSLLQKATHLQLVQHSSAGK
jgi:hypothetical protein